MEVGDYHCFGFEGPRFARCTSRRRGRRKVLSARIRSARSIDADGVSATALVLALDVIQMDRVFLAQGHGLLADASRAGAWRGRLRAHMKKRSVCAGRGGTGSRGRARRLGE